MPAVPEELVDIGFKSSFQTSIDMQIEEFEQFSEVKIAYFDEWVNIHTV